MKERETAYNCLVAIEMDGQYSNIVLKNCKDTTPLVTQLVYGTLRNYRYVRESWQKYAQNKKTPTKVAILLDMSAYELLMLNKPAYATVNEIVEIAKTIKGGNFANFVNAIARKIKKEENSQLSLAVETSHPDWLVNLWKAHYGQEICEKICWEDQKDGRVCLRYNPDKITIQELLKDDKFSLGYVEGSLYYDGNIVDTTYFKKGWVIIQSESSQLAVKQLKCQDHWKVLDLCAAPGSKTVQIAQMMHNTGEVISNDVYDFRVNLIEKNAKKYGLTNVKTCVHDGREIDQYYPQGSFDGVLLDAPCSGLGTLKHKPEIRITTLPQDLDSIVALQAQLLQEAGKMVKDHGVLVYSTCTLNKKENEKQVEKFIKEHPQFVLESSRTVFPFEFDSDGFYIARMVKKGMEE